MDKNFIFAFKIYYKVRWFKIILIISVLIGGGYAWVSNIYEERQVFVVEKEVPYPVDKVFVQFDNFQNFTRWNAYFVAEKKYAYTYFLPYEGEGSTMAFRSMKDKDFGQVYIRNIKPLKFIKYEIYEGNDETPYNIEVKFISKGEKTKLIWKLETPKMSMLKRYFNSYSEKEVSENIAKSMRNLSSLLSGKVEREVMFSQIKYDSIMVEDQEERLLLGLNVSTNNKKGNLFKNINLTHNKLISFVTKDLAKGEDEFGQPILLTEAGDLKNKEVSYFYGVPLSKIEKITDNNFIFKKQEKTQIYTIYYKGNYENRMRAIQQLLNKAKKDSLKNGKLEELFIDFPMQSKEVVLKISLPVYNKKKVSS